MGSKKKTSVAVDVIKHEPLKTKEYEKELRRLHVELVKLQQWVVAKGLKVCIVFEGPTVPVKAEPLKPSLNALAHASSGLLRSPPRRKKRRPSSIFSAMFPTCQPPAKLSFLTAAGTTVRALNG
ncbi:hypothetical protein QE396_001055 [Enterobacter sp. SORGH_AS 287]|nr:hypothetical protein [Enterobacter sp. SORGH_AS_0287]